VLHDIRQVNGVAIDARLLEGAAEQLARGTDERMTGNILGITGLLADEHDFRFLRALAKHRLSAAEVQVAGLAPGRNVAHLR
jgi:hypothetical protein